MAYGDRGLTQMAAASGVSKQMLSFVVNGERPVTDDVYRARGRGSREGFRTPAGGRPGNGKDGAADAARAEGVTR